MSTPCEKCGVEIEFGMYPFCPHSRTSTVMITRDEIVGGLTVENYGPEPVTFYTHTERRKYMKEHGLSEKETFCPMPGTDKDPQGIPNPKGYLDPKTLDNARELVSRNGRTSSGFDAVGSGVLRNLTTQTIEDVETLHAYVRP